ncbi:MAG: homoserine dehydrogenase [Acidobacteriota bacterium]
MRSGERIAVGLIGFGTVGTGLVEFLLERAETVGDLYLKKVVVAHPEKPREVSFKGITGNVREILDDPEIQIVVELMGGEQPALSYVLESLENGKSVVTANKVVISRHMRDLFARARRKGVDLAFEASVAGSIPIIRILKGFANERILRVTGILNGTSNYILSRMEEGLGFEAALKLAQEKGFAEADHILDTGGFDARDKLAIVAALAFNTPMDPERIYCEGITGITSIDLDFGVRYGVGEGEPGYAVKLLATARLGDDDALELHVYPALVHRHHPLAAVYEEMNAIYLEGERCGPQLYLGRGAGRSATTSAVVSDLLRLAANRRRGIVDELPSLAGAVPIADVRKLKRRGYVRLNLKHMPGSIAEATRIMGRHGFNIEDSVQRRRFQMQFNGQVYMPDIVTVEPLPYGVVEDALEELQASERVHGMPFYLRFEE